MEKDSYATGRDLTEAEVFSKRVQEATRMAETRKAENQLDRGAGGSPAVDQCSTKAYDGGGPVGTADQEARYHLNTLISAKMNRIQQAQQDMTEAHYLQALMESLPTKMSHDAAMGLKLLVRSYGNSPLRY